MPLVLYPLENYELIKCYDPIKILGLRKQFNAIWFRQQDIIKSHTFEVTAIRID